MSKKVIEEIKKPDLSQFSADELAKFKDLVGQIQQTGKAYVVRKQKETEAAAKSQTTQIAAATYKVTATADHLFLDDKLMPGDIVHVPIPSDKAWQVARNFEEFTKSVTTKLPVFVSFDFDLASSKTGLDCAKWLVNHCIEKDLKLPDWTSHSASLVNRQLIDNELFNFGKTKKKRKAV